MYSKDQHALGTIIVASALTGCKSTAEKAADSALLANCNLKIVANYDEMLAASPTDSQIPNLKRNYQQWTGTSLLPFGSRESAVQEASVKVCQKGFSDVFVLRDGEKTYSSKERLIGGIYHEYFLMPYEFTELSEESLVAQLEEWISYSKARYANKHRSNLFALAKANKQYKSVSAVITKHIKNAPEFSETSYSSYLDRSHGYEIYLNVYKGLVDVYMSHNDEATQTLVNWVKYHPTSTIKYISYEQLIKAGETDIVEDLLSSEQNEKLKKLVGKLFI